MGRKRALRLLQVAEDSIAQARQELSDAPVTSDPIAWTFQPKDFSDWDDVLITNTLLGSIANPSPGEYMMTLDPSGLSGLRTELQSSRAGGNAIPGQKNYKWQFMIPSESDIGTTFCHIAQFKSDLACYTGGLRIVNEQVVLQVRGGHMLGPDGGCQFEYDEMIVLGSLVRDFWHDVNVHALWAVVGEIEASLGIDGPIPEWDQRKNIPTVGDTATAMKFRVGLYRGSKTIGGPTILRVRDVATD